MLNFVLLAVCICIAIALILYLFYWNRLLAFIFGILCRLYFWNQNEQSIWLTIGEFSGTVLQISLNAFQDPFISLFSEGGFC